jgi:hypothetical protein
VEPNLDPSPIRFVRAICGDLRQSERREWWLAIPAHPPQLSPKWHAHDRTHLIGAEE